jgi:hypothetical protein
MMSRKHYKYLAQRISWLCEESAQDLDRFTMDCMLNEIAEFFLHDNPNFSPEKFFSTITHLDKVREKRNV